MSNFNPQSTRRHFFKYLGVSAASAVALGTSGTFLFEPRSQVAEAAGVQEQLKSGSSATKKGVTIVLVHGALADASTWSRVVPLLQAQGYNTLAVQLPLTSLAEDIAITQQALATISGPIILVAHSYGAQ